MKLRSSIVKQVMDFKPGCLFDFQNLEYPVTKSNNVAVILHDLKSKGIVCTLGKGVFYRPVVSELGLGNLPIEKSKIFDYVLRKYNGHLAGSYIYNGLNLTTQVAFVVTIATPNPFRPVEIGRFKFTSEKCNIGFIDHDHDLIGYLDALKNISSIPGTTATKAFVVLEKEIKYLDMSRSKSLADYSLSYPPRVRLLLSMILEKTGQTELAKSIISEVNQSTIVAFKMERQKYELA